MTNNDTRRQHVENRGYGNERINGNIVSYAGGQTGAHSNGMCGGCDSGEINNNFTLEMVLQQPFSVIKQKKWQQLLYFQNLRGKLREARAFLCKYCIVTTCIPAVFVTSMCTYDSVIGVGRRHFRNRLELGVYICS